MDSSAVVFLVRKGPVGPPDSGGPEGGSPGGGAGRKLSQIFHACDKVKTNLGQPTGLKYELDKDVLNLAEAPFSTPKSGLDHPCSNTISCYLFSSLNCFFKGLGPKLQTTRPCLQR